MFEFKVEKEVTAFDLLSLSPEIPVTNFLESSVKQMMRAKLLESIDVLVEHTQIEKLKDPITGNVVCRGSLYFSGNANENL